MIRRWRENNSLGRLVLRGLGGTAVLVRSGEWGGLTRCAARDVSGVREIPSGSRGRWQREDAEPEQRDREQEEKCEGPHPLVSLLDGVLVLHERGVTDRP